MKCTQALVVALALPLSGCGWFGIGGGPAKVPVVGESPDGGRIVAVEKFMLQLDEPQGVTLKLDSVSDQAVVMHWGPSYGLHHLQIDTKTAYMHDDLEAMKNEYRTELTAFSVGEGQELENGFDLYYSHWSSGGKRVGYQAEVTVAGTKYRCYVYSDVNTAVMKHARQMCRSLRKLDALPTAPPEKP